MSDSEMVMTDVSIFPHLNICVILSGLPAPRFCPVIEDTAIPRDIAGRKTNISIRPTAPKAFVAALPKALTRAVMTIVLMETSDCWTTDGRPI